MSLLICNNLCDYKIHSYHSFKTKIIKIIMINLTRDRRNSKI